MKKQESERGRKGEWERVPLPLSHSPTLPLLIFIAGVGIVLAAGGYAGHLLLADWHPEGAWLARAGAALYALLLIISITVALLRRVRSV